MEEQKDMFALLDMVVQPVFCVKENRIIHVNAAARKLYLTIGDDVASLLEIGSWRKSERNSPFSSPSIPSTAWAGR